MDEIKSCLPQEPNLRRDLARSLRSNFLAMGDKKSADIFLNIEIQANEELSKSILLSRTQYFKENYDLIDRIWEGLRYIASRLSGLIWGYGYRVDRLLMSFVFITIICSLATYFLGINFIVDPDTSPRSLSFGESILSAFSGTISVSVLSVIPTSLLGKLILLAESFFGTIFLALLAATFYRRITR